MTRSIVLSVLLSAAPSSARAEDYQTLWAERLSALAQAAQTTSQKVSIEERIRRSTTIDVAALPAHVAEGLAERRAKLANVDAFRLRSTIVERENELTRDEAAPNCQDRLLGAVKTHRDYNALAASEMTDIHSELLGLAKKAAGGLTAESNPLKARLDADAKIMDDLRARFRPEPQHVQNVGYLLAEYWNLALERDYNAEIERTRLAIKGHATVRRLSDEFDRGSSRNLLVMEFRVAGPTLIACGPVLASEKALPGQTGREKYRVIYASCVRVSLRDGSIQGETLASSLRGGRSSMIIETEEKAYVAELGNSCLDLAAARLALADR